MRSNIKIGKIFGININLNYSWFFIVLLLSWTLAIDFFPRYYPGFSSTEYWIIGIVSAVLLFVSVFAHELMHSLVAKRYKMGVEKITLFFFGGVAQIKGKGITPKKEFFMAIAGPIFSLFLALVFWIIFKLAGAAYIQAVCFYLYRLNLILGLFNLAPGFPLDGGRILRSILWGYFKDIKKATKYAAYSGKGISVLLIALGFIGILMGYGTLWFILIGIFLYFMAEMSYEQIVLKEVLSKVKIKEVLNKNFVSVRKNLTIADLFSKYFLKYNSNSFIVVENGRFAGVVNDICLKQVPKKEWLNIFVKDVMIPADKIDSIESDELAYNVLIKMNKQRISVIPVIKNKRIIGVVDVVSLIRYSNLK